MSPFMVVAPHCEAMRWAIGYTGTHVRNMWFWMGGYLVLCVESVVRKYITSNNEDKTPNPIANTHHMLKRSDTGDIANSKTD